MVYDHCVGNGYCPVRRACPRAFITGPAHPNGLGKGCLDCRPERLCPAFLTEYPKPERKPCFSNWNRICIPKWIRKPGNFTLDREQWEVRYVWLNRIHRLWRKPAEEMTDSNLKTLIGVSSQPVLSSSIKNNVLLFLNCIPWVLCLKRCWSWTPWWPAEYWDILNCNFSNRPILSLAYSDVAIPLPIFHPLKITSCYFLLHSLSPSFKKVLVLNTLVTCRKLRQLKQQLQ